MNTLNQLKGLATTFCKRSHENLSLEIISLESRIHYGRRYNHTSSKLKMLINRNGLHWERVAKSSKTVQMILVQVNYISRVATLNIFIANTLYNGLFWLQVTTLHSAVVGKIIKGGTNDV
jgi:hypothetical protein